MSMFKSILSCIVPALGRFSYPGGSRDYSTVFPFAPLALVALSGLFLAAAVRAQRRRLPDEHGWRRAGQSRRILSRSMNPVRRMAGGYSGDLVVAQCQWGPCTYNVVTARSGRTSSPARNARTAAADATRRLSATAHEGVSVVFSSPSLSPGSDTYILADNYSGRSRKRFLQPGPTLAGLQGDQRGALVLWGPDGLEDARASRGSSGPMPISGGSPCTVSTWTSPAAPQFRGPVSVVV